MKRYENFVGLTEVKAAQARVVEREKKFIDQQELRREAQAKITEVQKKIKVSHQSISAVLGMKYFYNEIFSFPFQDIHVELEKTHRGEDRYLVLVTQEHQVTLQPSLTFY